MKISAWSRRFHDPWGNKNGNRFGHITGYQFQIAQSEVSDDRRQMVDSHSGRFDRMKRYESNGSRFVKTTGQGVESLRR